MAVNRHLKILLALIVTALSLLSACSTTTEQVEYSMLTQICDEADATNLNCRRYDILAGESAKVLQ